MLPAGVAVLERVGLREAVGGRALQSVRYHGFGLTAESPFGRGVVALAQRRLHLDRALLDAARATQGVTVFEDAEVEGAERAGGRAVGLRVGGEICRAALVVGADGLASRVRRSLDLDAPARGRRVGARMHFRLATGRDPGDRLSIFIGRGYELYAAPLPDGELLLAGLADQEEWAQGARRALRRWILETPVLRDLLDDADPLTTPAGRTGLARQARAGWSPGAVLLGDAAASTDPLTAGGLAHALVTAERLAAAVPAYLVDGDPVLARFDRERRRLLRPHAWLTRGLVGIVRRPLLARATLHVMRAVPPLMRALVEVAGGTSIQAPRIVAASSSPAPAMSSATDQKAILPQRFGSP